MLYSEVVFENATHIYCEAEGHKGVAAIEKEHGKVCFSFTFKRYVLRSNEFFPVVGYEAEGAKTFAEITKDA